jgi:hypothetical protein
MKSYLEPGITPHATFAQYLGAPMWSASDMRAYREGPPARVLWRRSSRSGETPATRLGTAAHCAILEPIRCGATYVCKPEGMTFASREGKAWRDEHAGRAILSADEFDAVRGIVSAVESKSAAVSVITSAMREASLVWQDRTTGAWCKARPDAYDTATRTLVDLKITRHAGPGLAREAFRAGWIHQLAHYRSGLTTLGLTVDRCGIVAVSPEAPHWVYLAQIRENDLDMCLLQNVRTLEAMLECSTLDVWPDTPDEWQPLAVPDYVWQSEEIEVETEEE